MGYNENFIPRFTYQKLLLALSLAGLTPIANAGHLEEVLIEAEPFSLKSAHSADLTQVQAADSAEFLKTVPGANLNSNGPLTGIAQYRGMFGDRVAVSIDGGKMVTAGPNAMDAPLSNIAPGDLKNLKVEQGISSVSSAQESIGGAIHAERNTGSYSKGESWETRGALGLDGSTNNDGSQGRALVWLSNQHNKAGLNVNRQQGGDQRAADHIIMSPSEIDRAQYSAFYGYRQQGTEVELLLNKVDTVNTGTAALPMDIREIDATKAQVEWKQALGEAKLKIMASRSDVYHEMDNFSLRPVMSGDPANQRLTKADGRQNYLKAALAFPMDTVEFEIGMDYSASEHQADILNPDNPMFYVNNFNQVRREITGWYQELRLEEDAWKWQMGLRTNSVKADAGQVDSSMAMMPGMMGVMVSQLRDEFNQGDRARTFNNIELVIKGAYSLSNQWTLRAALGHKARAPSYQELYLWLPLQSTAGLADGRNYLGNLDLESEKAGEVNLGADFTQGESKVSLHTYYRDVADYIQGTPATSMAANTLSNMMMNHGKDALQFNNVEAVIYGAELTYGHQLSAHWSLGGALNYVRGKRTDISENLYRIAPLNHRLSIGYEKGSFDARLISELYAKQDSSSSLEKENAGYGLLHLQAQWRVLHELILQVGISNVLDKKYQPHLNGVNRVMGSAVAVGERLYGMGRSADVSVSYSF